MSVDRFIGRDLIRFLVSENGVSALTALPTKLSARVTEAAKAYDSRAQAQNAVRSARTAELRAERLEERKIEKQRAEAEVEDRRLLNLAPLEIIKITKELATRASDMVPPHVHLVTYDVWREWGNQRCVVSQLEVDYIDLKHYPYKPLDRENDPQRLLLVRFAPGRSVEWVEKYCDKHRRFRLATIWDGLSLPPEEVLGRSIIMAESRWFPSVSMGGDSYSFPVFFPNKDGETFLGDIRPFCPLASTDDLWWLMIEQ